MLANEKNVGACKKDVGTHKKVMPRLCYHQKFFMWCSLHIEIFVAIDFFMQL
jgi:hypothetical protein